MKILRIINILLLSTFVLMVAYGLAAAAGTCAYNSCSEGGTTPWTANSASYADVNYCVNTCASRGDTVIVPAGSANWGSELTITKSIVLQAATAQNGDTTCDAGETCITSTQTENGICVQGETTDSCRYMIRYVPSSIASDKDTLFRVSGFFLDADFKVGHVLVLNASTTAHNKVRVDNNAMIDANYAGATSGSDTRSSIIIHGTVYGVIDNNYFTGAPILRMVGIGKTMWSTFGMYRPGTGNTFFVEDNTFTYNYPAHTDWVRSLDSTGWGASWVVRYNDYIANPASSASIMIWDSHPGATVLGTYATRGKEAYGNDLTGMGRFVARCNGGQSIVYYNRDNDTSSTYVPALISQFDYANKDGLTTCGSNAVPSEIGRTTCAAAVDGYTQPQHPHREYEWANWYGSTPTKWRGYVPSGAIALRSNLDYFNYNTNFGARTSGNSTGVGCGTLANRPSTCSTGVLYWATDQSCSDISTHVGKAPAAPIAGIGYRCNSTDTWSVYYTPYAYPHPLRAAADTTAPTVSNVSPTVQQACNDESDPYTASSHAISFNTNENATCRYTIGSTEAYADLDTEMTGAGGTSHSSTVSLTCGQNSTIFYACTDGTNVSDTASWTFGVSAAADEDSPTVSSLTITNQACAITNKLVIGTSEPATCRYCKDDAGVTCNSATVWADRTQFSVTGGDTVHHEVSISQACSASATYNIFCQDTNGNQSSNLAVSITTDAGKTVSIGSGSLTIGIGTGSNSIGIIP